MTVDEWLAYGHGAGYISAGFCVTHDGAPVTAVEEAELEGGGDPCCWAYRLRTPDMGELRGGREGWSS